MTDHDPAPCTACDFLRIAHQYVEGTTTDGAQAEQTNLDGFHFFSTPEILFFRRPA
jgi:hypothetical protein